MRKEIIILASILTISACISHGGNSNINQTEQIANWYDTLNIHEISINNMSVITDTSTLFDNFGYPESIIEDGGFFTIKKPYNSNYKPGDKTEYQGFIYEGISFAVWDDQVRLRRVSFINPDLEIITPKGIFSNKTTIEELRQIFPNSFARRNSVKTITMKMDGDEIVPDDKAEIENNEPLGLLDGVTFDIPLIDFSFKNNRLVSIYIRSRQ